MDLKTFTENFALLADTANGIPKLREMILQLAVRGKLVPQDSNDEPARLLLQKITEEKARLIEEGKIKKHKPLPEISDDEKPFELPAGWEFVRLGNIANKIGSGSTPRGGKSAYVESGIPFLRSQNVWNHGLELREVAYISEETHQKMSNTVVLPNDILLNITGASLGRCALYEDGLGEANVSQHVTIIRPTDAETRFYLHLCILSPYTQALIWSRQVGMAREGLSKKVLELFEIPIPPLSELHRVVAKVDELMALCDELEKRQEKRDTVRLSMNSACMHELTSP
jgi:type I restriction enzyme S subunit